MVSRTAPASEALSLGPRRESREATENAMLEGSTKAWKHTDRRSFIGGSDARIIMGDDEAALLRLWREKRGEVEPEDLSGNLIVQLGRRDRGPQSALVRAQYRPGHQGRPAAGPASGPPLDGGHPGRPGRGHRGGVRGQVHAAVVVLGGSGGRKTHGAAAAQYVGGQCHGRRCCRSSPAAANGSRSPSMPIRSTSTSSSPPRRNSGAASRAASPLACSASSRRGRASRRSGSSI